MEEIYNVANANTDALQSQIMSWKSLQCEYRKLGFDEDAEKVSVFVKQLESAFEQSIILRNISKLHAPKKKNIWNFGLKPASLKF